MADRTYPDCKTESDIERHIESETNHIDAVFMAGGMTQAEYDNAIERLVNWADAQYAKIP